MGTVLGIASRATSPYRTLPPECRLSQASHRYMARAIASHAKQLREGIDEKNAETLFATSILVVLHAIVSRRFLDGNKEGARLPLHWFKSYQGVQAVVQAGWQWIPNKDIRRLVQRPIRPPDSLPPALEKKITHLISSSAVWTPKNTLMTPPSKPTHPVSPCSPTSTPVPCTDICLDSPLGSLLVL